MNPTRIVALLATMLALGCAAQRQLVITSDPSGAAVEIDGQRRGTTPLELSFEHYGARQVQLSLPGYASWTKTVRVKPPWYGRFPFDLISEILIPVGWRDQHKVHGELVLAEGIVDDPNLQAVLARARALRDIMEDARSKALAGTRSAESKTPALAPDVDVPEPADPNNASAGEPEE